MADERPQYYENTLVPLPVNKTNLSNSLHELRAAVRKGAELIHTNDALPEKWGVEGMFKHFPGAKAYQEPRLLGGSLTERRNCLGFLTPRLPVLCSSR